MDPVLTLILLLAIITSLLYFYFWIRSIARKVDRRGLDVRLEELESSVRETTRWLETASVQIREDLENRMNALKYMLDDAENTNVSSRLRADQTESQILEPPPGSITLEPTTETVPVPSSGPATAGTGIANQQSIDSSPDLAPASTPLALGAESGLDPVSYSDQPPVGPPADSRPVPVDPPDILTAEPETGDPGSLPSAFEPAESPPSVPDPSPPDGPSDRRAQILQLADRGVDLAEIARQLDTSRAEVELIVSFRRPR